MYIAGQAFLMNLYPGSFGLSLIFAALFYSAIAVPPSPPFVALKTNAISGITKSYNIGSPTSVSVISLGRHLSNVISCSPISDL
jgi:hypothetical protein